MKEDKVRLEVPLKHFLHYSFSNVVQEISLKSIKWQQFYVVFCNVLKLKFLLLAWHDSNSCALKWPLNL